MAAALIIRYSPYTVACSNRKGIKYIYSGTLLDIVDFQCNKVSENPENIKKVKRLK